MVKLVAPVGLALMLAGSLAGSLAGPAAAQALRSPSANSVAAGATAERNSTPTSAATGLPGITARQSTASGTGSGSAVTILGMPLRVSAPVTAPYNDSSFGTFAGQPMRGRDAVMQQSIDGAP